MGKIFCAKTVVLVFIMVGQVFGQQMFFRLEKENTAIKENIKPLLSETCYSQTSCFLSCLNHQQCCFVQIKELVDQWFCSFFPFVNLSNSQNVANSNIFSADDSEKCVVKECLNLYQAGFKTDGIYDIVVNQKVTKVFCDMTNEGGGWTVFQRRIDGSVAFQRTWNEYKNGFGDVHGEYWLGNELIHQMTKGSKNVLIRIKATSFQGVTKYIIFKGFWIENETNKYLLHTGAFKDGEETLGGDWLKHNGLLFTTKDKKNGPYSYGNCALIYSGGWWYSTCFAINPNNIFNNAEDIPFGRGMTWASWRGQTKALKHFSMALKALP